MKSKKRWFKLIGLILIFSGILGVSLYFRSSSDIDEFLEEKIENDNYYAILEIPKIKLKKELFNDIRNNVDINLFVQENSFFPDAINSNVIIAGHSGNGIHAYFKNLYKLEIDDIVYIYYNGYKYSYYVKKIEEQNKTGFLYIEKIDGEAITLITCTKNKDDKQTIYYGILENKEKV